MESCINVQDLVNNIIDQVNNIIDQSPRFKSFGSRLNSLNAALRPNLRPNSDDSFVSRD